MARAPKPIGNGVCEIDLSKGLVALISEGDAEQIGRYNWHVSASKTSYYAKSKIPGLQVRVFMHRLILCFPILDVDHINQNSLDNRRENLRLCTHQQNSCNRIRKVAKTSEFIGVHRCGDKWQSQMRHQYKLRTIGYFSSEIDAARAWDAEAYRLRGEFAQLNFPDRKPKPRCRGCGGVNVGDVCLVCACIALKEVSIPISKRSSS